MSIYALGDPHLSFTTDKPMNIFGEKWDNHADKIRDSWLGTVTADDWVLIPGDISWAMTLEEAAADLDFLGQLPGKKVVIRGNHDYWWSSLTKVRSILPDRMYALQNDSLQIGEIAICGTRGWECPGSFQFTEHDQTVYEREVWRLELSLQSADKHAAERWVMLHYPPTNEKHQVSGFIEVMKRYGVSRCIYGHLHGQAGHRNALEGEFEGIRFNLTSCDYIDFKPIQLL